MFHFQHNQLVTFDLNEIQQRTTSASSQRFLALQDTQRTERLRHLDSFTVQLRIKRGICVELFLFLFFLPFSSVHLNLKKPIHTSKSKSPRLSYHMIKTNQKCLPPKATALAPTPAAAPHAAATPAAATDTRPRGTAAGMAPRTVAADTAPPRPATSATAARTHACRRAVAVGFIPQSPLIIKDLAVVGVIAIRRVTIAEGAPEGGRQSES
jgi:hypothetical protein